MLTKQQKLDVLSKAIDEGAVIDISFFDVTKSKAALLTTGFAEMIGASTEVENRGNVFWYQARSEDRDIKVTAFYKPTKESYMVEDVVRTIEEEKV